MAIRFQLRRGTTAQNDSFVGAEGEITFDTGTKSIRVHDGVAAGGSKVPTLIAVQHPTAENGYTWYRLYNDGWVEQGGRVQSTTTDYGEQTVYFPVEMADIGYMVTITPESSYGNTQAAKGYSFSHPTTTTMRVYPQAQQYTWGNYWKVEGMAA